MELINHVKKLFDLILEPKLKWNINTLGLLKKVALENDKLIVKVALVTNDEAQISHFKEETLKQLKSFFDGEIELTITQAGVSNSGITGIKKIIMVVSGKGGVGKSTVSVNLTAALAQKGYKVGLLDADIYGPSIPIMLGCEDQKPSVAQNETLVPLEVQGIKFISLGSLVDKEKAIGWRGQMVSGTILQFIQHTAWEDLDFLVIDMPPGTGDIHLTLASALKPDGVVVVTTPQEVVLGDVRRSISLLKEQHFPIIGLVENMSYLVCENCSHENHPFHQSIHTIEQYPIIAKLPLSHSISAAGDEGIPIVFQNTNQEISKIYHDLSQKVIDFTSS